MTGGSVLTMAEAAAEYARYLLSARASALRRLLVVPPGRNELSGAERRLARRADRGMRRLRIRCLARSLVVARMLRRRGVAAAVSLSVAAADRRAAHAVVTVGGRPLEAHPSGNVPFV